MNPTWKPRIGGRQGSGLASLIAALALMVGLLVAPVAMAQDPTEPPPDDNVMVPGTGDASESDDSSPDAEVPADDATREDDEEEATEEPRQPLPPASSGLFSATDPGSPAVLAHGLAYLTGSQVVWQVREVQPADAADAQAEVSNAAIVYQVAGSSVIRNNVTGKRALLNPGEAYFKAAGDPYTTMANSTGSVIWVFEVASSTDVASDAFYESPLIDDYREGVYDLQFVRFVLEPGESASLPPHTGPALVISTNGDIDVEGESIGLLATGDGQLVIGAATVVNNSQEPVDFGLLMYGEEVSDASAAPPAAPPPAPDPDPDPDPDGPAQGSEEIPPPSDESLPGDPGTDTPPPASGVGGNQESINITASVELYVVVVADGVTVFDGPIPAGSKSGEIFGSTFEVYTSNGGQTLFTNSCGEQFLMGYETGEARYTLTADAQSCL